MISKLEWLKTALLIVLVISMIFIIMLDRELLNDDESTAVPIAIKRENKQTIFNLTFLNLDTAYVLPFEFLENPSHHCIDPPFLLMITLSAPTHFKAREVIRNHRGNITNVAEHKVVQLFIVGKQANDTGNVIRHLHMEYLEYEDIILIDAFDNYQNVTLKAAMLLKWAVHHCRRAKYILKTDDDVLVILKNTVMLLESAPPRNVAIGRVFPHAFALRNQTAKNRSTKQQWPYKYYPPFIVGVTCIVSQDVAQRMYEQSLHIRMFHIQDVYYGILFWLIGIKPQHNNHFAVLASNVCKLPCCRNNIVAVHFSGTENLYRHIKNVTEYNLLNDTKSCI
ncbi:beta-1,3-galactosyltransferase 1-like [Saccoglossus kowalevskii]|uniref:Hexosyltransferase n=1 Tax=Saccoglossus kowalevskii TaxID=10224 RepID=A0ABM0MUV7_SACKO|nr:PREDICTED: beta-1,3-galactosyltransferase 1-like [Saccoglossus kowalevskii]